MVPSRACATRRAWPPSALSAPHRRRAAGRRRSPSDGVKHLPAVHQRVLGLERVGQAVELLEPGIGVVLAVLGVAGDLHGDDVLGHVLAPVGAERGTEDPGADEGAPRLVLAPARQLSFGKEALVLLRLLGPDVYDDDVQLAHLTTAPRFVRMLILRLFCLYESILGVRPRHGGNSCPPGAPGTGPAGCRGQGTTAGQA